MEEPAKHFINDLETVLGGLKRNAALSRTQKVGLGFCLTGMLLMNSVCWAKFERASLGRYKISALSWIFRDAKICWNIMLQASVLLILKRYGITEGVITIDESDRARSKRTKRIYQCISKNTKRQADMLMANPWFDCCL
jgi:hypothetical protein